MSTVGTSARIPGNRLGSVSAIGMIVVVVGIIMALAGGFTWYEVQTQLADEKITVSADATMFAGQPVNSPWTAYRRPRRSRSTRLEASGGKTYAETAA